MSNLIHATTPDGQKLYRVVTLTGKATTVAITLSEFLDRDHFTVEEVENGSVKIFYREQHMATGYIEVERTK